MRESAQQSSVAGKGAEELRAILNDFFGHVRWGRS